MAEHVFTRQVEGSVWGRCAALASRRAAARHVEGALRAAKARGMLTIAMTGRDGGKMGAEADIHLNVAEASTPRIQEVHRTIMHAICTLIDQHVRAAPNA